MAVGLGSAAWAGGAPVFERLAGTWSGHGTLMGRPAAFRMDWRHAGGFASLSFSNAWVDSAGAEIPVLSSAAVYRTDPARPEAVWLDSRGVRIEIAWEASDSTLIARWVAPAESGRTTYRWRGPDVLETLDEVARGDSLRTFARATWRRLH